MKNRLRTIAARVTYAEYRMLREWARADRAPVSALIREMLERERMRRAAPPISERERIGPLG